MIYGLSTLVILFINYYHVKEEKIGIYFTFSNLYYFIYVVVPFMLQYGYIKKPDIGGAIKIISKYNSNSHLVGYANILVLTGLLIIALFSLYSPRREKMVGVQKEDVYRAGVTGVILGTIAFGIVVFSAGGLVDLLAIANDLRGGDKSLPGGFFIHIGKLVWAGSIILFGAMMDGYRRKYALLVLSILVSLLVLLGIAGRAVIVIYLAGFPFIFYIKNQKIYVKRTIVLFVVSIAIIVYGDYLFRSFSEQGALAARTEIVVQGGAHWIVQNILREFTFPYTNVLVSISEIKSLWDVYLLELPKGIINTLPGGAVGFSYLNTLSDVNTLRYGTPGEIPVDMISLGYHTMGAIGVILTVSICCITFSNLDEHMYGYDSYVFISLHALLSCKLCFVAMYADMHQVISGNFYIIFTVALIFFFKELRKRAS